MEQPTEYMPEVDVRQQMASYYNSPMNAYGSSIIHLTNPNNELQRMELTFRGLREDGEGNVVEVGMPLMNEKGILAVVGMVQSIMNQVTVLSNLNKDEVPNLMKFWIYTIIKDLMLNKKRYDIGLSWETKEVDVPITDIYGAIYYRKEMKKILYYDRAARDKIMNIALNTVFICMKRSFEGDDKRFWKGTQHENIVRMENQGHGGSGTKGIGSILNFWKK